MGDREDLRKLINDLAVVRGRVTLSSGQEADWYVDLRRVTLHHVGGPLVGQVMLDVTDGWDFDAGSNTITFYGAACESLQDGEVNDLQIVYGCPSSPVD